MGIKAIVLGAMLAGIAGGAVAQSLDPVRVEMLRSILKGNDCTLTEAAAANILPRFDFTREETRAIVGALVAAGEVVLEGNTLQLVDGSCDGPDPVAEILAREDVQQFIGIMAEHGCSMAEDDAGPIFRPRGMNRRQVSRIVTRMIANDMADFTDGVLTISSAYCASDSGAVPVDGPVPGGLVAERSGIFALTRVRQLADAMVTNACLLNLQSPDGFLAEIDMTHDFAKNIAAKLLADGYASMIDEQYMRLMPPFCVAADGPVPTPAETPAETPTEPPVNTPVETPAETPTEPPSAQEGTPLAAFIAVAAQNGCALNITMAEEPLQAAGLRMDQAFRIADELRASGQASLGENGYMLNLDPALCAGGAAAAPAEQPTEQPAEQTATASPDASSGEEDSGVFALPGVQRLVAGMAANGCRISLSAPDSFWEEIGIERSAGVYYVSLLVRDGSMISGESGFVLPPPYCIATDGPAGAPEEPPVESPGETTATASPAAPTTVDPSDPRAGVLAMLAQNGCEITQANAAEMIAAAGLEFNPTMALLSQMMAAGEASTPDGGQTLQVGPPLCEAAAPATPRTPREIFINLIRQNGCSITAAEFGTLLPVDGLDAGTAFALISELEAEGAITLPPTRDVVTLSTEMCR